jgi:hypothetical protein
LPALSVLPKLLQLLPLIFGEDGLYFGIGLVIPIAIEKQAIATKPGFLEKVRKP